MSFKKSGDFCPVTGENQCHCADKAATPLGAAIRMDLGGVLRKLFTDHAVYTNWLILASLPILQRDAPDVVERLLKNPDDIAALIAQIKGPQAATAAQQVISDHLLLANAALKPVREENAAETQMAVNAFYVQGDTFGDVLSSLNPKKLTKEQARAMVRKHNEYVVQLATLRTQGKFKEYIMIYDEYYKHMLMFSDQVYNTLL